MCVSEEEIVHVCSRHCPYVWCGYL